MVWGEFWVAWRSLKGFLGAFGGAHEGFPDVSDKFLRARKSANAEHRASSRSIMQAVWALPSC